METDMLIEDKVKEDLHRYLLLQGEVDEMLPDAPDIEEKWQQIAQAYLPDGMREFPSYPVVSLGWMMYVGMAVAKYWDDDWAVYGQVEDLYTRMRDKRGYDSMDEYIREEVLLLKGTDYDNTEKLLSECAARTYSKLRHEQIEPGTPAAFHAYVACLHQLYLMGAAVQLHRMGYHMSKVTPS